MSDLIHQGHRTRIRTSYRERGLNGMSDCEVLELLLTCAIPRKDVNPIAHRLLQVFGDLNGVLRAPEEALTCVEGVGARTASYLHTLFAVHRRLELQAMRSTAGTVRLEKAEDACRYALQLAKGDGCEALRLISLDATMTVLHADVLHAGSADADADLPKRAIEVALLCRARYVILTRTRLLGLPLPTEEDLQLAERIREIAAALELDVQDQLILAQNAAYSVQRSCVFHFLSPAMCRAMPMEEYREAVRQSLPCGLQTPS